MCVRVAPQIRFYTRTKDQNESLGLFAESAGQGFEDEASALEHDTTMGADAAAAAVAAGAGAGAAAGAGAKEEPADVEGDSALMVGSAATTVWESKDLDGNVPGKFKKGGALIQNPTERGAQTERVRRAEAVRDDSGALSGLVFDSSSSDAAKEVMRFPTNCTNCSAKGECRMCVTDVPHFKEVILMSFSCDECGWKDVEVKGGGAVPDKGTLTELRYNPDAPTAHADLTRDVIKGDSANVEIPEIDLVLSHGSLGGMYTTVEGLLTAIRDKLVETDPFHAERGDSAGGEQYRAFEQFLENLERVRSGSMAFTLRLRDPMANSWIYSPLAPAPDPALVHVEYERSAEEDLELGLLDMKVENYASAEDEEAAAKANAPTHATA
ncbi:ZPR1 zinc finger domain-containing protein [archaeon]|nr:MAG: ZPR1 zinc finger domain-containing protein [archaeon]